MANEDGASGGAGAAGSTTTTSNSSSNSSSKGRKRPLALRSGLALYRRLVRCVPHNTALLHTTTRHQDQIPTSIHPLTIINIIMQDQRLFPGSHPGMVLGHDVSHFCDSLMYGELSGATLRRAFCLIEEE